MTCQTLPRRLRRALVVLALLLGQIAAGAAAAQPSCSDCGDTATVMPALDPASSPDAPSGQEEQAPECQIAPSACSIPSLSLPTTPDAHISTERTARLPIAEEATPMSIDIPPLYDPPRT